MKPSNQTPNWAALIDQLLAFGLTHRQIGNAMASVLTVRMVRHYQLGTQPTHYRGELLIGLWCSTLNRKREDMPLAELIRGHRVAKREPDAGPRIQSLPPLLTPNPVASRPTPQPSVKPKRKQRGMVPA